MDIKLMVAKWVYEIIKPYTKVKWFVNPKDNRINFWVEMFGQEVSRSSFDPLKFIFEKEV